MKRTSLAFTVLALAVAIPAFAQGGSWTHRSYWHQSNGTFDHNAWVVEIDSFVTHQMTCNIAWSGVGIVKNAYGDPGHVGTVSGNIMALVSAYPGQGAAIVYRAPIENLRPGGFTENTICK